MIIYPAIDMKDGNCVRLRQGKFDDVTVFCDDPLEVAKKWERLGAEFIHLVDLDGARGGKSENSKKVIEIAKNVKVPVQIGGGIRNIETVKYYIENGVSRVILGTAAIKDIKFTKMALLEYGDKIAIGIDAKDGFVAVEGWEEVSSIKAIEFAKKMCDLGVSTIIYTDIATDGMMQGPNATAMGEMVNAVTCNVIASGGVSNILDIEKLKNKGVSGAIIGKALYINNIDLKEAIENAKG